MNVLPVDRADLEIRAKGIWFRNENGVTSRLRKPRLTEAKGMPEAEAKIAMIVGEHGQQLDESWCLAVREHKKLQVAALRPTYLPRPDGEISPETRAWSRGKAPHSKTRENFHDGASLPREGLRGVAREERLEVGGKLLVDAETVYG
jgi:hypothetical protein